jgi:hypothetical protein
VIMKLIIIINGSGQIISKDSQAADFAKGQTILLPAAFSGEMFFDSDTEYLSVNQ